MFMMHVSIVVTAGGNILFVAESEHDALVAAVRAFAFDRTTSSVHRWHNFAVVHKTLINDTDSCLRILEEQHVTDPELLEALSKKSTKPRFFSEIALGDDEDAKYREAWWKGRRHFYS